MAIIIAAATILWSTAAPAKKRSKQKHRAPAPKSVNVEPADSSSANTVDDGATRDGAGSSGDEHAGPPPERHPDPDHVEETKRIDSSSAEPSPVEDIQPSPALDAVIGAAALFRTFAWHQDLTPQLPGYSLSPGPEGRIALEVFPAAFTSGGPISDVGIVGMFGRSIGVTSQAQTGAALTTTAEDFLFGLKARIPLGSLTPYLSATYGGQSFTIAGQNNTTGVPGTDYRFLRGGVGTRIAISPVFSLDVGVAYLFVTALGSGSGDIGSSAFFPKGKADAVDADLSVAARLTKIVGFRVGIAARQYGLSFNVQKGDPNLVGGAIDRYVVAGGGIEVLLDRAKTSSAAAPNEVTDGESPSPSQAARERTPTSDNEPSE